MCDPLSLAAVATVGSLAASGYGMYQQNQAIQDQNAANEQWRRWQEQQRLAAQQKDEELRRQADAARNGSLEKLGAEQQKEAQTTESARLSDYYDGGATDVNKASVNAALLSGQQDGGEEFQTDVAKRLTTAAQEARARIKALADINSYGGSFNGLAARNSEIFAESGQGIDLANNMRRGNLAQYQIAQNVQPMQLAPVTDYASGVGNALAGIAGKAWGNHMGGKV
jgi:hypothetical protein